MRKSWEECNKPQRLTLEYATTIGAKLFTPRPTQQYFKLYNFFKRLDESVLDLFHEYLQAHDAMPGLTMKALFYKAPRWNQEQRKVHINETHVENYLKLLEDW